MVKQRSVAVVEKHGRPSLCQTHVAIGPRKTFRVRECLWCLSVLSMPPRRHSSKRYTAHSRHGEEKEKTLRRPCRVAKKRHTQRPFSDTFSGIAHTQKLSLPIRLMITFATNMIDKVDSEKHYATCGRPWKDCQQWLSGKLFDTVRCLHWREDDLDRPYLEHTILANRDETRHCRSSPRERKYDPLPHETMLNLEEMSEREQPDKEAEDQQVLERSGLDVKVKNGTGKKSSNKE